MKTIYLVRHAKSSWDFPELDDFQRPLSSRGKSDAPRMGKFLNDQQIHPELVVSSPAERAIKTAKKVAAELGIDKREIITDKSVYHAWPDRLLKVVVELDDQHTSVMLFGHNPGLTEFANQLAAASIENIPTAGAVGISFEVNYWRDIGYEAGKLLFFHYPKGLPEGY
ncbi:histidine phosphatase family protein [uncultured Imperialibacter sp.]|uniref:SixA phosphatase family protein n=1 Tax=uncultured Imperialibacter sp. TaxID=1672639 RepID=UPI0030D8FC9C